ncbi:MAG TPA: DUF167 family protein [Bryobacteraceae bacterium]|jgi:hypothetical protein
MKVLLADDDRDQLHLRAMVLAKSGFEIIEASDSASAIKAAKEHKPQCAVVDLRFPTQVHGLALIRALKALDAAMCVIVLTGADPGNLDHMPEKSLIDEVIVKGSASAQLVTKLRQFAGSVTFDVKVIPRSSKSEVNEVMDDGSLKVKLRAVPEKGYANEELIGVLAEHFKVPKSSVELLSGETSRRKRVRIIKAR